MSGVDWVAAYRTAAAEYVFVRADGDAAKRFAATCMGCAWTSGVLSLDEAKHEANRHALGCAALSPEWWPGLIRPDGGEGR